jgi:hypothetical protein
MDLNSSEKSTWLVSSLDYHQAFSKTLKWQTQLNFAYMDWGPITALIWPAGMLHTPVRPYPDGMYGHPHSRDFRYGLDSYVSYEPIHDLNLIAGVAAEFITTKDDDRPVSNGPDATGVPATEVLQQPRPLRAGRLCARVTIDSSRAEAHRRRTLRPIQRLRRNHQSQGGPGVQLPGQGLGQGPVCDGVPSADLSRDVVPEQPSVSTATRTTRPRPS